MKWPFLVLLLPFAQGVHYEGVDATGDHSPPLDSLDFLAINVTSKQMVSINLTFDSLSETMLDRLVAVEFAGSEHTLSYSCRLGINNGMNNCWGHYDERVSNATEVVSDGFGFPVEAAIVENVLQLHHPQSVNETSLDVYVRFVSVRLQPEAGAYQDGSPVAVVYGPASDTFGGTSNFGIGNVTIIEPLAPKPETPQTEPAEAKETPFPWTFCLLLPLANRFLS